MLRVNKYKDFTTQGFFLMRHIQLLSRGSVGSHDIICSLHRRNAEFSARTYARMFATLKKILFKRFFVCLHIAGASAASVVCLPDSPRFVHVHKHARVCELMSERWKEESWWDSFTTFTS